MTQLVTGFTVDKLLQHLESKQINHVFPASQFKVLKVNALAGSLHVTGDDTDSVSIEAHVCTHEIKYLDQMTIDVDDKTDVLELTVIIPYHQKGWHADYAYMDVVVTAPRSLIIEIKDSSGDIVTRNATVSSIDDSSGNIRAASLSGNLEVKDSSGDISIRDLDGDLTIDDSSGRIDVRGITGNVTIPRDSSGDIEIDTVSGIVLIERDSSGEIEIENVKQNVRIESDGSGGIRISKVDGSVNIGSDGSGNVRVSYVEGDFVLGAKGSGNIRTSHIKGDISTPR